MQQALWVGAVSKFERRMSQMETLDEPPIRPVYWQVSPNEDIAIGNVDVSVNTHNTSFAESEPAEVILRFVPKCSVEFRLPPRDNGTLLRAFTSTDDLNEMRLLDYEHTVEVNLKRAASDATVFETSHSRVQVRPRTKTISHAIFHLLNWPTVLGGGSYQLRGGVPDRVTTKGCGRFVMEADGWVISVAETGETQALVESLKSEGGYAITHVGEIRRADSQSFPSEQLEEVLDTGLSSLLLYFCAWPMECSKSFCRL